MCDRLVLEYEREVLYYTYEADVSAIRDDYAKYNVTLRNMVPVLTTEDPKRFRMMSMGFLPDRRLVNARAEGKYNDKDDPANFRKKGIQNMPTFAQAIRHRRCVIPVSHFIEGTEDQGLKEPYLVFLQGKPIFSLAGIWNRWTDPKTGLPAEGFAIITTVATPLLQKLPHPRSPVILPDGYEKKWLSGETSLADVLGVLEPYNDSRWPMNAYRVTSKLSDPKYKAPDVVKPILQNNQLVLPRVVRQKQLFTMDEDKERMSQGKKGLLEREDTLKKLAALAKKDPPSS